jgi:hypothetical protein
MSLILEGLVTTLDPDGSPHLAPMGPRVEVDFARFVLRPFSTSNTYKNLRRHPEGVLHVTDDALLLAKAAIGAVGILPPIRPAERVRGVVLTDSCRHFEFVARSIDDSTERVTIEAEVVHARRTRDFFGFNRAKHAVVEAAILAGSMGMLPSASLGGRVGLYEPVHGTAPDIAGKGMANPIAAILSGAMLLRYSLNRGPDADRIEAAVLHVLEEGYRTADIRAEGTRSVGTTEMGDLIVRRVEGSYS